jgi:cleavage and polyadenylation specificity factor subunit 5
MLLRVAEIGGLQRKLTRHLAPEQEAELQMRWQVADCLGRFYRPNFETLLYPYCPPHIERPKETKKIFLVNLPERAFLTVRRVALCFAQSPFHP